MEKTIHHMWNNRHNLFFLFDAKVIVKSFDNRGPKVSIVVGVVPKEERQLPK
jgi:hypothetical protein